MAYEFEKLSEVGSLDEFPEGAKVLIEHDGDIKRCAADGLGGGGGYHWIHLDINVEAEEITCDEEITFESLREDVVNGLIPIVIVDASMTTEDGETSSMLATAPLIYIEESSFGSDKQGRAMFLDICALRYEDGQYVWMFGM